MTQKVVDAFLAAVDPDKTKVAAFPECVAVFGGPITHKRSRSTKSKSQRDVFLKWIRANHPALEGDLILPESFEDWSYFDTYSDLLLFEKDLAELTNAVVVFVEGPGAIAELGAFSQIDSLSQRLVIVVTDDRHPKNSFISLGSIRSVKETQRHDAREAIQKEDKNAAVSVFQLRMVDKEYSDFDSFDVNRECESPYFRRHRALQEFCSGQPIDAMTAAKAIRPMLEGYLHRRFPGLIPSDLLFGQVVTLIRNAAPGSPLAHAKVLIESLNDINDYAGQFHHDTDLGKADSVRSVTELKNYAERALRIVHSGAPA